MTLRRRVHRLTPAQRRRAERSYLAARRIAGAFARHYPRVGLDWDSLAGEAVCQAASTWRRVAGGAPWHCHLASRVRGACLDELRRLPRAVLVPLPALLHAEDLPVGWELESEDAVLALLARLPIAHQRVMRPLCLDAGSLTTNEAGRRLGLDGSTVRNYRQAAVARLREVTG